LQVEKRTIRNLLDPIRKGQHPSYNFSERDHLIKAGIPPAIARWVELQCKFLQSESPSMPPTEFIEANIKALIELCGACVIPVLFSEFGDLVDLDVFYKIPDSSTLSLREVAMEVLPKFLGRCPKLDLLPEDDKDAEKLLHAFFQLKRIPTKKCMEERTKTFNVVSSPQSDLEKMMAGACSQDADTEFDLTVGWFASTCLQ